MRDWRFTLPTWSNGWKPEAGAAAQPVAVADGKPAVYLAECSFDRRNDREALRTELHMRGYRVLPDLHLPEDEAEYMAEVSRLLAESALAIHLVGNLYGAVRDGPSQESVVELQNELAVARARGLEFPAHHIAAPRSALR